MNNIDRAAKTIADALRPGLLMADGIGLDLAHLLADAGLLMPDDATTQTETVGPCFPEDEEMPDHPATADPSAPGRKHDQAIPLHDHPAR